jgi:hypothetical protein
VVLLSEKHPPKSTSIRDTLFGDMPVSEWPRADAADQEPWRTFVAARSCIHAGERAQAVAHLESVTEMPGLESRHYLQAWHFLRQLDITPPAHKAKELYGVVVEVGLGTGLEMVAGYADLSARYLHASGSMIIWEVPDETIGTAIRALLDTARPVVAQIGPWEGERRPPPGQNAVRINMLTPSGLHFGEGPWNVLSSDPMGSPVLAAAASLMAELVGKTQDSAD